MSENRVLRRIFGPKRNEWRKLHNKELDDRYFSPNFTGFIKPRRMRWAWHVARMGEGHTRFWWGNLRERDHLEGPFIDESTIKLDLQDVGWRGGGHELD